MSETIFYRLMWQTRAVHPGAHAGKLAGAGQLFQRYDTLLVRPDPRRIDLRASVLDPLQQFQVRSYQQHSYVNVYMMADMSASMSYAGQSHKQQVVFQLLSGLAQSVLGYGDKFGFIGCSNQVQPHCLLPLSQQWQRIAAFLTEFKNTPFIGSAQGLLSAWQYLSTHRSLVFLVSDFNFPVPQINQLLANLHPHQIIPIVLWDNDEYQNLPPWGLMTLKDMESGATRLVCLRPALREKIIAAYTQRQIQLKNCFRGHGCEPLFLTDGYNAGSINRYFQQRAA